MFKVIYTTLALTLPLSIYHNNLIVAAIIVVVFIITLLWNLDKLELTRIQTIIKDLGKTEAKEVIHEPTFSKLPMSQKLIYLAAFKSGVEFIIMKLK